ncbi:MAG: hypothetical protein Q7K65_05590 [Candidatus Buchananbacteria bacterium]|nr:hypothetical protein [Candidatus Buchananbacteria bacterium]
MKNRAGRPWTQEEIDLIIDDSPNKLSAKDISELIDRSVSAIYNKRRILLHPEYRIKLKTAYYRRHRLGKINSLIKKRWTEEETEAITSPNQPSDVELSKILDRSVAAIQVRRSVLRQQELCFI